MYFYYHFAFTSSYDVIHLVILSDFITTYALNNATKYFKKCKTTATNKSHSTFKSFFLLLYINNSLLQQQKPLFTGKCAAFLYVSRCSLPYNGLDHTTASGCFRCIEERAQKNTVQERVAKYNT